MAAMPCGVRERAASLSRPSASRPALRAHPRGRPATEAAAAAAAAKGAEAAAAAPGRGTTHWRWGADARRSRPAASTASASTASPAAAVLSGRHAHGRAPAAAPSLSRLAAAAAIWRGGPTGRRGLRLGHRVAVVLLEPGEEALDRVVLHSAESVPVGPHLVGVRGSGFGVKV